MDSSKERIGLSNMNGDQEQSMKLEDLQANAAVRGILSDGLVTVVSVQWFGSEALELTYKTPTGKVANELLYRHDEPRLEIVEVGRPWSFDGDGALFRLVSEAQRIRLAHLFDPVLAVHTSVVEPLPHQITAVYESMLPRQPLRFLLADDPGAGKTIMAGLLIKELIARGDLQRCLVVCPGSLAEQWQDELYRRFQLPFDILTNDKLEAARTGNWFLETNLVIARLDKLSRNEDVQQKLQVPDCRWDLVVCDEAHKMSATFFGGEVKYTKRYRLGQLLSTLTRHFLLMTATPHNGKEEDFQLFMALLDGDRFEGRFRDGVHVADVSDLMRRMVKENLLKFDGTPLFPERIAYTVPYKLSEAEAHLYKAVTDYVREEFNRAEALENDKRAGTVGFGLLLACDAATRVRRLNAFYRADTEAPSASSSAPLLLVPSDDSHFFPPPPPVDDNTPLPDRLSVTAFRDYITCPYRFYLRRVLRLVGSAEPGDEMDGALFGTLAHEVLQVFGGSSEATSQKPNAIEDCLLHALREIAVTHFGDQPRPSIAVQLDQLRLRLHHFAHVQAELAAAGWKIHQVELNERVPFEVDGEPFTLLGRIDRIDVHPEHGARIVDYKTGDLSRISTFSTSSRISRLRSRGNRSSQKVSTLWGHRRLLR